jgi:transcription initiation factor IIF auxiliary subunit
MSPEKLDFKFGNTAKKVGVRTFGKRDTPWYKWTVFMGESPEKLALVDYVEYRLHDTFPDPIRTSDDENDKFSISSAGWGEFTIYITVYLKDGREIETTHYLRLFS